MWDGSLTTGKNTCPSPETDVGETPELSRLFNSLQIVIIHFIWELQLFRLFLPHISTNTWWDVLGIRELSRRGGDEINPHIVDGQMLFPTSMLEQATWFCMECHAKDPLNTLTERFGCTPFSLSEMFPIPFALWNAWKLLLTTETNMLSLLSLKWALNWFQGKCFPQTWLQAVIGLYVTHPFWHAH